MHLTLFIFNMVELAVNTVSGLSCAIYYIVKTTVTSKNLNKNVNNSTKKLTPSTKSENAIDKSSTSDETPVE